jgi:predicted dehydrogenase
MKNIAIIGAGQLGSRHLQGLVKYVEKLNIYVLDPSLESLKIAQERENEITHSHEVSYSQQWDILPEDLDIVVIATSANVREALIDQLLLKHKVNFLILEKVLFQELEAYERINKLLLKYNVTTYVNHPRRMFDSYKNLKVILTSGKQNIFNVVGGNWGLGCNALHFLDLFIYLSEEKLSEFSTSDIDDKLLDSNRKGFVEFTGTMTGRLSKGSLFSISSLDNEFSSITVTISNDEERFVVQEGGTPKIYELSKKESFNLITHDFNVEYQSALTCKIVSELLKNGVCSLPTYDEARHTHELFIRGMLEKFNAINGLQATILPIT